MRAYFVAPIPAIQSRRCPVAVVEADGMAVIGDVGEETAKPKSTRKLIPLRARVRAKGQGKKYQINSMC